MPYLLSGLPGLRLVLGLRAFTIISPFLLSGLPGLRLVLGLRAFTIVSPFFFIVRITTLAQGS